MSDLGNKEIFASNLKYYMEIYNKDRNDLFKILDIPYTTLSDWLNAKKYPRIDKIELLANYFSIQKSDLIECKNNDSVTSSIDKYRMLFDKDPRLTPEQKEFFIDMIENQHRKFDEAQENGNVN